GVWEEHEGTWEMIVRNPDDPGNASVRYSASAITESTLHASMDPPRPGSGTTFDRGDAVPLRVQHSGDDQAPVSNASVTVTPNVPLVSLGTLLSSAHVTAEELSRVPTQVNGEPLSEQ